MARYLPHRALVAAALALFSVAEARAAGASSQPVVLLEITAPRTLKLLSPPIEMSSGWPLKFRATAFNSLGLALDTGLPEYPILGSEGYVVLKDPDGCLEIPPPSAATRNPLCVDTPTDETYIIFHADVDQAGVPDNVGDAARGAALADPTVSGEPLFNSRTDDDPVIVEAIPVGPVTGGNVADGYGYGADDDWASLVVLVPHGNGLVLGADFSRPSVLTQRNLAGFLNWSAYELSDLLGGVAVEGGMIVPYGLVAPMMLADDCGGATNGSVCEGQSSYRIDGGPVVLSARTGGIGNAQFTYPALVGATRFEVRAFVVSGVAPSQLRDENGDGKVTAADAKLAGHTVVSNEVVVQLRQYHGDPCGVGLANVVRGDLDGNNYALSSFVCPAGPGQIKKPPQ